MAEVNEEPVCLIETLLPDEMLLEIFNYLDVATLCLGVSRVCKRWQELYRDKSIKCWPGTFNVHFHCHRDSLPVLPAANHPSTIHVTQIHVTVSCAEVSYINGRDDIKRFWQTAGVVFPDVKSFRVEKRRERNVKPFTSCGIDDVIDSWPNLEELDIGPVVLPVKTIKKLFDMRNLRKLSLGGGLLHKATPTFLNWVKTCENLHDLRFARNCNIAQYFSNNAMFREFFHEVGAKLKEICFRAPCQGTLLDIATLCPNIVKLTIQDVNKLSVDECVPAVKYLAERQLTELALEDLTHYWPFGNIASSTVMDNILGIPEIAAIKVLSLTANFSLHSALSAIATSCANLIEFTFTVPRQYTDNGSGLALVLNCCKKLRRLYLYCNLSESNGWRHDGEVNSSLLKAAMLNAPVLDTVGVDNEIESQCFRDMLSAANTNIKILQLRKCTCIEERIRWNLHRSFIETFIEHS